MKILSVFTLSIALLAGCSSSDKKDSSTEQASLANTDTTNVNTAAEEAAQFAITTQKLTDDSETSGLILKTGQLNYTGNEPFTHPALFVEGKETYKLAADSVFMNETFKELNGKQASIYGKIREIGSSVFLEVHYYKLSENK